MNSLSEPLLSIVMLVARVCLAAVFLVSGIHKGIWFSAAIEEFRMARLPAPAAFAMGTVILHVVCSLFIIAGVLVFESALALAVFTSLATIRVHNCWTCAPELRLPRSRVALANLAVIGGLLLLAVAGPGRFVV